LLLGCSLAGLGGYSRFPGGLPDLAYLRLRRATSFLEPFNLLPASISSYAWSFSDGGVASGVLVTHFFSLSSQNYTATLKITCSNGTTASVTRGLSWGVGIPGFIGPGVGYN
jgi:hypothetical protein